MHLDRVRECVHQRKAEPDASCVWAFLPASVVADDDLGDTVADARVDVDGDRARLACMSDRIPERFVCS